MDIWLGQTLKQVSPMQTDTLNQLSGTTVVLHWLVGLAVIAMLAIGIYMTETETFALYPWHKSFGVLIFFIVIARVAWRIRNGWPEPVSRMQRSEFLLMRTVQTVLLVATVLMPVSGFLMSSLGGTGVAVFGLEIVARNPDPENPMRVIAHNESLAGFFRAVHGWTAYTIIAALFLHISGALKHHLLDKDGTLRRMLGTRVDRVD